MAEVQATTYETTMSFLEPWTKPENPFIRTQPAEGFQYMNFTWHDYPVKITDARPNKSEYDINKHSFAYADDPDPLPEDLIKAIRANEKDKIHEQYYPHIEKLLKKKTGASRVIIFDNTVRKRRPEMGMKENPNGREQPATMVHCDQSTKGAMGRLKQNLGADEDIEAVLKGRVQLLNVWRPLNGPVKDWPLATMDYRSLQPSDVHPCDLLKNEYEERGQTVTLCHNKDQEFYYLDAHRPDEVTLIKIWDNQEDVEAKLCAHAAFKHPNTPADVEPRESIEVRCFVIY